MWSRKPNPKRRIAPEGLDQTEIARLVDLSLKVVYTGNPVHKRNPGDFGLKPPACARPGKTLCDGASVLTIKEATSLLKQGLQRGLVSAGSKGWPQNIWAVSQNGCALEAMLEQQEQGHYHGYPMQDDDPLADEVKKRWSA